MNKLILIGNGFDLAHGLPTSYRDFLDNFWRSLSANFSNDLIKEIVYVNDMYTSFFEFSVKTENFKDFWKNVEDYRFKRGFHVDNENYELKKGSRETPIFYFKNLFFREINLKSSIQGWIDIENEYYLRLKKIVNQSAKTVRGRKESDESLSLRKREEVVKLNQDFDQVKKLLEE